MEKNKKFFSSWSGGKDSCLAFFKAKKLGYSPKYLFTAFDSDGKSTRAHGLGEDIVREQAKQLSLELYIANAGWGRYEEKLLEFMRKAKEDGVDYGVFGDIDLASHREWLERVCEKACIIPIFPLWGMKRIDVVKEFIDLGFKAKIAAYKNEYDLKDYVNTNLDNNIIDEFIKMGIDPAGENGEYHTIVYAGPIFKKDLDIEREKFIINDKNTIVKYKLK
ncbi:MAG: diphthine--ammonia ligase [Andreesenia angusta]|nr:diphthine--ammonia ligase [Andreesenia angusta]